MKEKDGGRKGTKEKREGTGRLGRKRKAVGELDPALKWHVRVARSNLTHCATIAALQLSSLTSCITHLSI